MTDNMYRIIVRTGMIIFWIIILMFILYIPTKMRMISQKSITILTWAEMIDPAIIHDFERETGIKVNVCFFESNEELFVKLLTSRAEGFDLIIPSDYSIEKLRSYSLLKPLDKKRLLFWDRINPNLVGKFYDPTNTFSIPYYWAIYGLGINKRYFNHAVEPTWGLLFDAFPKNSTVAMLNAPREALLITAQYLFGTIDNLSLTQLDMIKKVLIEQKKHVEAYVDADVRADYLLTSGISPVVIIATPFIINTLKNNPDIDFIIPKEGSFMLIDNLVISAACKKDDLVYQFINYLFRPDVLKHHFEKYPFFPVTQEFFTLLEQAGAHQAIINAHRATNLDFFRSVIDENTINNIWMALKVA